MDEIPVSDVMEYETWLKDYVKHKEPKLLSDIKKEGQITDSLEKELDRLLSNFTEAWNEKKGEIL